MAGEQTKTVDRDAHLRSWVKAFSWRFVGSMDTLILSFLVTGNIVWAGGIASAETLTKIVLFYLHERGWRRIAWGREGGGHRRAVVKGVTWRIIGTADTFLLSWLITGHMGSAAKIASLETVTKITLFYFHEQLWTRIKWGQAAPEAEPAALVMVNSA